MLFLHYLLLITGFGLFAGAAAILVYDLYTIFKGRKPAHDPNAPLPELPVRSPGALGGAAYTIVARGALAPRAKTGDLRDRSAAGRTEHRRDPQRDRRRAG